jgi:hypothetical protein
MMVVEYSVKLSDAISKHGIWRIRMKTTLRKQTTVENTCGMVVPVESSMFIIVS